MNAAPKKSQLSHVHLGKSTEESGPWRAPLRVMPWHMADSKCGKHSTASAVVFTILTQHDFKIPKA